MSQCFRSWRDCTISIVCPLGGNVQFYVHLRQPGRVYRNLTNPQLREADILICHSVFAWWDCTISIVSPLGGDAHFWVHLLKRACNRKYTQGSARLIFQFPLRFLFEEVYILFHMSALCIPTSRRQQKISPKHKVSFP